MIGQVAPFRFNNQNTNSSAQAVSFKQNPANKALDGFSRAVDDIAPRAFEKNSQFNKAQQFMAQKLGFSQEINSFEGVW